MKPATQTTFTKIEKGITQRGPASFLVRMMVGGQKISETFRSLGEARAFRDTKLAASALDPDFKKVLASRVSKREATSASLGSLLDRYKDEITTTKKGAVPEGHRIAKLKRDAIAQKSIYRITPEDILEFLSKLQRHQDGPLQGKPLSNTSRRKYASLLSHLFTVARKRWRMKVTNPVDDIELPQQGKPRKRRLEDGEESRLLAELGKSRNPLMLPLVKLAIETAMRQGELLALEWKNIKIHGDHGTAALHDTKNGDSRIVPLNTFACEILSALPRPIRGGQVFPIGKNSVRTAWDMACQRAGIEDLRFHDLRHEATSRLFELGLDRIEAASVTGHKTLQMLKDYTHLRAEKLAQKMNRASENKS